MGVTGGAGALVDSHARGGHLGARGGSSSGSSEGEGVAPGPQLRWEPFVEGEPRPLLAPEEYARRVSASRRRMLIDGPSQRNGAHGSGELHRGPDGIENLRE